MCDLLWSDPNDGTEDTEQVKKWIQNSLSGNKMFASLRGANAIQGRNGGGYGNQGGRGKGGRGKDKGYGDGGGVNEAKAQSIQAEYLSELLEPYFLGDYSSTDFAREFRKAGKDRFCV